MKKRILAMLLALFLVAPMVPAQAFAAQAGPVIQITEGPGYAVAYCTFPEEDMDNEALFTKYAQRVVFGEMSESRQLNNGTLAGDQLVGTERILYDILIPFFQQVADGQRASTVIGIGQDVTSSQGRFFPGEVPATFKDNIWTKENLDRLFDALLADLPYEQYWCDKTTGVYMYWFWDDQDIMTNFTMEFAVAENVRGEAPYTVDTAKTKAPKAALENARKIVKDCADLPDIRKLESYKDEICALTEYNYDAIYGDWSYSVDNNPWQLIHVFDGDPSTNVVCEGYSKAFQYLCDLTDFDNIVKCTSVSGGAFGGQPHMWNTVSYNGKNYLVDVTNVDIGPFGNNRLFMVGGEGSIENGYMVAGYDYVYRDDIITLWGDGEDSILNLSPRDCDIYNPPFIIRQYGKNRYETCFEIADLLKGVRGKGDFQSVIVASGTSFADALAGSTLAAEKEAPILLYNRAFMSELKDYIRQNLAPGGTVYILGGVNAVPAEMETGLEGYTVKRLGGDNRYETNLAILQEADNYTDVIVCTGSDFADSLSASATGQPVLLVRGELTAQQKQFLEKTTGTITILGGINAVPTALENQLKEYADVKRIAGDNRYDTSTLLAERICEAPTLAILACGKDFPDGLCGGPLAYALGCPMILTANERSGYAESYAGDHGIGSGYILGGPVLISDKTVLKIFN